MDAFLAAARRGDAAAAQAMVSTRDPGLAGRAAVWAGNLGRIAWSRQTWTARPAQAELPEARRAELNGEGWVQQVSIAWSLPGEPRVAADELWLTFVDEPDPDGGTTTRLAGDRDGAAAPRPTPIWWQQPVRLLRTDHALVLTDADDATTWLRQAAAARQAVADRVGVAGRDDDGLLVVEVPQSRAVFERTLGVAAGSYAAVAAAAWPMGTDTSTAPIHVVVNPEASRRLSVLGRDVLLTHEAVHVATRSPGSPTPTWLVEGYADQLAYAAQPAGSRPALAAVRTAVRAHGTPKGWPAEGDFAPDAADLDLAYDLAWTAARSIADSHGPAALNRFYAAVDRGESPAEAAKAIGTTERALLEHWRQDLERIAS